MNLKSYFAKDIKNKEALAHQCVEIANKAKFNTDFQDVYDHLFFGDDLMLVFAFDENEKMIGFSSIYLTKEEDNTPHIHLNGIIVDPENQKSGVARMMLSRAAGFIYGINDVQESVDFKISLSARTQNPAIYKLMSKLSENISPSSTGVVNKQHHAILKKMDKNLKPFLGNYDESFIVKNAYLSPKVQANIKDEQIKLLFSKLNKYDAFIIFGDKTINLDETQIYLGIKDYLDTMQQVADVKPCKEQNSSSSDFER